MTAPAYPIDGDREQDCAEEGTTAQQDCAEEGTTAQQDCAEEGTTAQRLMEESRGLAGKSIELLLALRGEDAVLSDTTKLRILRNLARDGAHQTNSPACLAIYKRVLADLEAVR